MALLSYDLISDIIEVARVYSAQQLARLERKAEPTRTPPGKPNVGPGTPSNPSNPTKEKA